jgi:hypothetical protein
MHVEDVVVPPAGTGTFSATLRQVVDTTNWLSGDFHLHARWSPDSDDAYTLKVAGFAAEHLEMPVATEHDYIGDYNPTIAAMGLTRHMKGIIGEEISTTAFGHFNAFPIRQIPEQSNQGAFIWYGTHATDLFGKVRAREPDAILQINHPRSSRTSGYFESMGFDPATASPDALHAGEWSEDFDAIEVWNGSRSGATSDWYAFLNKGKKVVAAGNSDSHRAVRQVIGYPRNYVKVGADRPDLVAADDFVAGIKAGRVVVSGGAFIEASIGAHGMGELVPATGGKVQVRVRVEAAAWVGAVETLSVVVNGQVVAQRTLDETTRDPQNPNVRFDGTIEVPVAADSWLAVKVEGSGSLWPVADKQVFAHTNAFYVDADSNGSWAAPGL